MGCCSSSQPYYEEPPEPAQAPPSPTWKLPAYPAPALPPLTRQNKVIIAASRVLEDPVELDKLKRHVLNGQGEALSIVFDDYEQNDLFVPEVKKLFNIALTITSIELHTANLDMEVEFLQSFLDTLPSHGELRAFSLVTARDCPLVFSSISGLLYRNPNLQALRLWGVDLTPAGSGNSFYPACKLVRVDLCCCKMLPQQLDTLLGASKDSLLCYKLDKPKGLSGSHIARSVNTYGKNVQMLTIILPDMSESELDQVASFLVGDTASRFPTSLKYLHLGGLAASDNLFNVTPSQATGGKPGDPPKTHLSQLVALRLDQCTRLTVNGLFGAIRQRNLPSLLRLHVYWLENEEAFNDLELWKNFAASEDIQVDVQTEGLIHITAMKDTTIRAARAVADGVTEGTSPQAQSAQNVQVPQPIQLVTGSVPYVTQLPGASHPALLGSVMPGGTPPMTQVQPAHISSANQQYLYPPTAGTGAHSKRSSRASSRKASRSRRNRDSDSGTSDSSTDSESDSDSDVDDHRYRRAGGRSPTPSSRSKRSGHSNRSHGRARR